MPPEVSSLIPEWVGQLSGSALIGALLYYLIVHQLPKMQDNFHAALDKEREQHGRSLSEQNSVFRESMREIFDRDDRRAEAIHSKLDTILHDKLRSTI